MVRQILVVDDNQDFLKLILKLFAQVEDRYSVLTCTDGGEAIEILKQRPIALVVTALQMPKMDGYALLEKMRRFFPDVPTIVATSFDKPKTREAVMRYGATAYFIKPLVFDMLVDTLDSTLKAQAGGGTLKNASLEMFLQLIEMEARTCTIRVINEVSLDQGVLFFREGDILNARHGAVTGIKAAYRILSWERVTLLIENSCMLSRKGIPGELQAVLLEAMRMRDEVEEGSPSIPSSGEPINGGGQTDGGPSDDLTRLQTLVKKATGNDGVIQEAVWAPELSEPMGVLQMFGNVVGAGPLKAILGTGESSQHLVVMGSGSPVRLVVGTKAQKESLIEAVLDL